MIRVNLLKIEKKELEAKPATLFEAEAKAKKKAPKGNLVIVLVLILLAVLAYLQNKDLKAERALLDAALEEKKTLEPVLTKLEQVEFQKSMLEKKIGLINQLKAQQGDAVKIMSELSTCLPDWVWLTEASLGRQSLQIKGKALSNILISDYMRNLENSGLFGTVSLLGSAQKTQGNSQFFEFALSANMLSPQEPAPPSKQAVARSTTEGR
ncbi:MAG: PilN domain-containing protein [Candidatus Aminicenantales bacterium]